MFVHREREGGVEGETERLPSAKTTTGEGKTETQEETEREGKERKHQRLIRSRQEEIGLLQHFFLVSGTREENVHEDGENDPRGARACAWFVAGYVQPGHIIPNLLRRVGDLRMVPRSLSRLEIEPAQA